MDYLQLKGKRFLVTGVANRKSVAYYTAKLLVDQQADVILSVQTDEIASRMEKLLPGCPLVTCDVEKEEDLAGLGAFFEKEEKPLDGFVHSIAFANYSEGLVPFHEIRKKDFLQAVDISCFSLTALANTLKPFLAGDASVVTISISTTRMASENYGYMGPVKAALDSTICFLAKSFSAFSRIRFNSVNPGLLKTSSSAGIPGYLDAYLFAEKLTLRKKAVQTQEVADTAAFLLSQRSSGINAQGIVIDAGMGVNYFDREIVEKSAD